LEPCALGESLEYRTYVIGPVDVGVVRPFLRIAKRLLRSRAVAAPAPASPAALPAAVRVVVIQREHPVPVLGERFSQEFRLRRTTVQSVRENQRRMAPGRGVLGPPHDHLPPAQRDGLLLGAERRREEQWNRGR